MLDGGALSYRYRPACYSSSAIEMSPVSRSFDIPSDYDHAPNPQIRTHVAMEGLLTPVSTSYKSSEKSAEDALCVYLRLNTLRA